MILVFGKTGQVATELQRIGDVTALGRDDIDLSKPKSCSDAIFKYAPSAVINAAAYTAVDKAEDEEELATLINGEAPAEMARACVEVDIPFVHLSTDYVFNGEGTRPWLPQDKTSPQNAYGRSKLAGEEDILTSGAVAVILRTSWVFSSHGSNFLKTMLGLAENHEELSVVSDQFGGPTPALDIARACLLITEELTRDPLKSGIYHFSGAPDVSWAEFASDIFFKAKTGTSVIPIATSDYPTKSVRPLNSRLDCSKLEEFFGVSRPCWRTGVIEVLKKLEVM